MKVYLIKTPECESKTIQSVSDFLTSFDGPLEFSFSDTVFDIKQFPFLVYDEINWPYSKEDEFDIDDLNLILRKMRLDKENVQSSEKVFFKDLYSICDFYREKFNVEADSFVVLLTKYNNEFNYFSSFDSNKNVFVNVNHWDFYTPNTDAKYPIAYQIVENILRSLMNIEFDPEAFMQFFQEKEAEIHSQEELDIVLTSYNQYAHYLPKVCMNDFCSFKKQVINKLQSGNICPICLAKIYEENIDSKLMLQVVSIFNGIRSEFMFKLSGQTFFQFSQNKTLPPYPLIVEKNNKIFIKTKTELIEIRLNPLCKMLYLFLLKNETGIRVKDLISHKDEFTQLYLKIRPGREHDKAGKSIDDLVNQKGDSSFNSHRSIINKRIEELLNNSGLADNYTINGDRGEAYSIKIPRDLVDNRF